MSSPAPFAALDIYSLFERCAFRAQAGSLLYCSVAMRDPPPISGRIERKRLLWLMPTWLHKRAKPSNCNLSAFVSASWHLG